MEYRTQMIIQSIAWSIGIVSFLVMTYAILSNNSKPVEKFTVVDQYEGCSVIRYTDPTSRWHYFLKCS